MYTERERERERDIELLAMKGLWGFRNDSEDWGGGGGSVM